MSCVIIVRDVADDAAGTKRGILACGSPPGCGAWVREKKSDSSSSSRTPRARSSAKLGGRNVRQPPPVERHTSVVPQAPRSSHQRRAAQDPGVCPTEHANQHHLKAVYSGNVLWEGGRPPRDRTGPPHPATRASACHPTVHIRLHHRRPPVSRTFSSACVHRTFQTGQSIALALRYGAPSLPFRGQDGMLRAVGHRCCPAAIDPPILHWTRAEVMSEV